MTEEVMTLTLDFYRAGDKMPDRNGRVAIVAYAHATPERDTQVCATAPDDWDATRSGRRFWAALEEGARLVDDDDLWAYVPTGADVVAGLGQPIERDPAQELRDAVIEWGAAGDEMEAAFAASADELHPEYEARSARWESAVDALGAAYRRLVGMEDS